MVASPIDVTIPLAPVYTETVTQAPLGMIGVMISGAPLFNDCENVRYFQPVKEIVRAFGSARSTCGSNRFRA